MVDVEYLVVDLPLTGLHSLSSDICFQTRLYCGTPDEMSTSNMKDNYRCTKVQIPTSKDVSNLESDRLVRREKKHDYNEFEIIDNKTQYTI